MRTKKETKTSCVSFVFQVSIGDTAGIGREKRKSFTVWEKYLFEIKFR
jgi:hypothetical protein